jgi:type IV conjugative transfer system coupling protein TraD
MAQEPPHLADDVSRGVGLIHLRLRIQFQSLVRIVLITLIGFVSVPIAMLWMRTEPHAISGAIWWKVAALFVENGAGDHLLQPMDDPRSWTAQSIVTNNWFTAQATAVGHLLGLGLIYGLLALPFLAVGLFFVARAIGSGARKPHLLRGRTIVEDRLLSDILIRAGAASDLVIGQVPLARGKETSHILMAGTIGAGKTQAIYRLLDTVRARGDIAIIYDIAGSYVSTFYHPDLGDHILNPLDARSASWSPWAEITSSASADRMAASIIPTQEGPNRFFSDGAQAIFSTGLRLMREMPNRTVLELFRRLIVAPRAEKERMFANTEIAKFYDKDAGRTVASIDVTAANYVRSLRFLKANAGRGDFSIAEFVRSADTAIGSTAPKPWLFISSRRNEHDALQPLITCMMDAAIAAALSLPENLDRRIWLFLDEVDSLNQMPSLSKALQEGRKNGICVVAGLQDYSQLIDVWGKDRGEAVLSMFNTTAIFRLNSVFSAEYASKTLGEAERERTEESARFGAHVGYESLNLGTRRDVERLVLPTDIMSLPDLTCYLRLPGRFPIARTTLPDPAKTARPRRHAGFEEADPSDTVEAQLARSLAARTIDPTTPEPHRPERLHEDVAPELVVADAKADRDTPEQALTFSPANDGTEMYPH